MNKIVDKLLENPLATAFVTACITTGIVNIIKAAKKD